MGYTKRGWLGYANRVGIILGLGYRNRGCLCCLGVQLRESRLLEPSGGVVTRIENIGIVWGLIYASLGCLRRLGAQLFEPRLLEQTGRVVARIEAIGIVWEVR